MKKIIGLITITTFISFNGKGQNKDLKKDTLNNPKTALKISNELDTFSDNDSLFSFKVPKGLFKQVSNNIFECESLNARIEFISNSTFWSDENVLNGTAKLYEKLDVIKTYKKNISNLYLVDKANWFVISGQNSNNKIIYTKGFFQKLKSMQGRDQGEMTWLWSKYGLLKIEYNKAFKKEFDLIIPIINKSFICDFSLI
jgi:hypothetical protein